MIGEGDRLTMGGRGLEGGGCGSEVGGGRGLGGAVYVACG